jgi:hypothetical protein
MCKTHGCRLPAPRPPGVGGPNFAAASYIVVRKLQKIKNAVGSNTLPPEKTLASTLASDGRRLGRHMAKSPYSPSRHIAGPRGGAGGIGSKKSKPKKSKPVIYGDSSDFNPTFLVTQVKTGKNREKRTNFHPSF